MSTPAWILEIFAAVTLLVAEVSAGQLVLARAWTRRTIADADVAVSRLLTGIAMAGILVSGLRFLPNGAWEVVFAVTTAWLAWRLWRESSGRGTGGAGRSRYAPPLVHSAAMLYLFAALAAPSAPGTGGMAGMDLTSSGLPTLQAPVLALIFTLLLIAFAVHDLDRRAGGDGYFEAAGRALVPAGSALAAVAGPAPGAGPGTESAPQAGTAARLLLSPAVVKGCQVATGVTMAFILVILI
jgi:hypothetical protein